MRDFIISIIFIAIFIAIRVNCKSECRDPYTEEVAPNGCATPCPPNCDNPNLTCVITVCNPYPCICKAGLIRSTNSSSCCIPIEYCKSKCRDPKTEIEAPNGCATACPPTCANPNPQVCTDNCNPYPCICKNGLIRSTNSSSCCILPKYCPPYVNA